MSSLAAATEAKARPLAIGPRIQVWPPVVLAPMAGVTNYPYRRICYDHGAGLCISEMVSARGLLEGSEKTWQLAHFGPEESPRSLQIFGAEPEVISEAVRRVRESVDHIDINFGCPAPKVMKKGGGASIPADPALCRRVVRAAVEAAAPVPVSIKVRLGLDEDRLTFRDAGRIAEEEGCAYIALHTRTVAQRYRGRARWDFIAELKRLVKIPVLGNGDVWQAPDALRMLAATGCDGVVIGRGCLGNPWLFRHLRQLFEGSGRPERPAVAELAEVIRRHFDLLRAELGREVAAAMQMRKFGAWYTHGLRGGAELRRRFQRIASESDFAAVLDEVRGSSWMENLPDPAEPSDYAQRSGLLSSELEDAPCGG